LFRRAVVVGRSARPLARAVAVVGSALRGRLGLWRPGARPVFDNVGLLPRLRLLLLWHEIRRIVFEGLLFFDG